MLKGYSFMPDRRFNEAAANGRGNPRRQSTPG